MVCDEMFAGVSLSPGSEALVGEKKGPQAWGKLILEVADVASSYSLGLSHTRWIPAAVCAKPRTKAGSMGRLSGC